MRNIARCTALAAAAIAIFLANVHLAWSNQGLTGEVRTTFVEAATRSCLKTQLDAPINKGVPVSALYDYCKCNASGMADKVSNDEVKTSRGHRQRGKISDGNAVQTGSQRKDVPGRDPQKPVEVNLMQNNSVRPFQG